VGKIITPWLTCCITPAPNTDVVLASFIEDVPT
jgi:hypothetical protein